MKICGIYKITCLINSNIYIGQSVNINERWRGHKKMYCGTANRLSRSMYKHGVENHKFEIIEECKTELLNEREHHWITHFDTFNTKHGLNLLDWGRVGCHKMADETRKKISESNKGRIISESQKKRISIANTGKIRTKQQILRSKQRVK